MAPIAPSSLSMALTAVLFLISLLSFMAFYADRFRLPLVLSLSDADCVFDIFSGVDHLFWSEPIQRSSGRSAEPRQVIGMAPGR